MNRVFPAVSAVAIGLGAVMGCGVMQRFPDDVQASLAHGEIRRLETDRFILYYPAHRRAEIDRFLVRADRCAGVLREAALLKQGAWNDKMVIAMPETAYNNALVMGELGGYEHVALIPTLSNDDLATEYGLLPDPGVIACHELVHYVHVEQIAGLWGTLRKVFGYVFTPQIAADSWFLEGLATHYEAKLQPGIGRPRWPIFTGMFAAAYAGERVGGGDLSRFGRRAPPGHQYLIGSMFVRYLTERYGEVAVWSAIGSQAKSITGLLFAGSFRSGFGKSLGDLLDEFDDWHTRMFPVRQRPAGQQRLAQLGRDARYARGRDGTEAWVTNDVDQPPRLVVRDPAGATLAEIRLVDLLPPRTLVDAAPGLVSGLSITADGSEVWLTMIDRDTTENVPRLLRWRRGDRGLTELSHSLGPGATVDPTGATYYYSDVDGDRWRLAAWDARRGTRRILVDAPPGTYVLGARVSPDGARLVADVWDGTAFVAWVIDAATGARLSEIRSAGPPGTPVWDASFTDDGRVMYLDVVDARFQVFLDGHPVTDAPYAVLAARAGRGTLRFLNREGWNWTLDEVALPSVRLPDAPAAPPPDAPADAQAPLAVTPPGTQPAPPASAPTVQSDQPYSPWEYFFFPQLRIPSFVRLSGNQTQYGIRLGGGDRLGMQRWDIAAHVQPPNDVTSDLHWGGEIAYLNTMLAPWQILATGELVDWVAPVTMEGSDVKRPETRRTRDASLSISRTWRDTITTTLSGLYTADYDHPPDLPAIDRRLGGPGVTLDWVSGEATAYTGARLVLAAEAAAAYYPHALSTFASDIYDTSGEIDTVLPLPIGARHTLTLQLRGRALVSHDDTGLLQLGGFSAGGTLVSGSSVSTAPPGFDDARFPPNLRFIEYLRGYEDYAITTDRAAIASVAWRYPIIIDRGVAATFGFLPASFLRQLDLELFATGAIDQQRARHAAAGGQLTLRFVLWVVPMQLGYQVARRIRDDNATTQLLELSFRL